MQGYAVFEIDGSEFTLVKVVGTLERAKELAQEDDRRYDEDGEGMALEWDGVMDVWAADSNYASSGYEIRPVEIEE